MLLADLHRLDLAKDGKQALLAAEAYLPTLEQEPDLQDLVPALQVPRVARHTYACWTVCMRACMLEDGMHA